MDVTALPGLGNLIALTQLFLILLMVRISLAMFAEVYHVIQMRTAQKSLLELSDSLKKQKTESEGIFYDTNTKSH